MAGTAKVRRAPGPLDTEFTVELLRSSARGGWTYVVMAGSAECFGTRGLVKVRGTVDGQQGGDTVIVRLEELLG